MSYATLLINWCGIQEYTITGTDSYGRDEGTWDWVAGYSEIPCRLMPTGGIELHIGAEVVIADYKLFLNDVPITEQNKVWVVLVLGGTAVLYDILLVKDIQDGTASHHKECLLRTIR